MSLGGWGGWYGNDSHENPASSCLGISLRAFSEERVYLILATVTTRLIKGAFKVGHGGLFGRLVQSLI